jgi:hypothetical protein
MCKLDDEGTWKHKIQTSREKDHLPKGNMRISQTWISLSGERHSFYSKERIHETQIKIKNKK